MALAGDEREPRLVYVARMRSLRAACITAAVCLACTGSNAWADTSASTATPSAAPAVSPPPVPPPGAPTPPASSAAPPQPAPLAAAPAQAPAGPPVTEPPPAPRSGGGPARTAGWLSIAVGGEAAVVAVVTSFMVLHEKGVRDDNCDARKVCSQTGIDANATIDTLLGWNAAAWIVAVAGLGAGTVLVLTHPSKSDRTVAIGVAPAPGGAALSVQGAF